MPLSRLTLHTSLGNSIHSQGFCCHLHTVISSPNNSTELQTYFPNYLKAPFIEQLCQALCKSITKTTQYKTESQRRLVTCPVNVWRRRDFNLHPCDSEACARSTTLNCKFTFPLPYFPLPANPSLLLLQFSPIWVENISSHSSIYEVTLTSFWFIPCPSNRASNPVNSPYMSPTCPFSPWLPKQPSSLPPPTNLHIMAKIIFLNHDFLSLPLLRTCDRPQLSRG